MLRDQPPAGAVVLQARDPNGVASGCPLVVLPLWTPVRYENQFEAALLGAARDRSVKRLESLIGLRESAIESLQMEALALSGVRRTFCGYRVFPLERVVLETGLGEIEIALRYDSAPLAAAAFLRLARAGFYDGIEVHRLVNADARGDPLLVQFGDPGGTGRGGSGERVAFEASELVQDFGVVSLARDPDDPDSGSSQVLICLSKAGGALLQGKYAAFAVVTRGAAVLAKLSALPTGPREASEPNSPRDRPLAQVRIEGSKVIPAPPLDGPVHAEAPAAAPPVER